MELKRKILLDFLSVVLIAAICFFLGREIIKNWEQIKGFSFKFDILLLIFASMIYALSFLFLAGGWYLILRYLKNPIPFVETLLYFYITQPAKYIPGKIWLAVARMKFCKAYKVPNSITLLTTGIEGIVEIIACSYIALVAFLQAGVLGKFSSWGILAATGCGLLILHPPIFYFFINLYLKIVKKEPIQKEQRRSFAQLLLLQMIYIIGMFLISSSQVIFLASLISFDKSEIPFLIGISAFTYMAGILAIFTPSGLGVREAIWYLALKPILAPSAALVYTFVSRLWMIIIEALLLFIALPILWVKHRFHKPNDVV